MDTRWFAIPLFLGLILSSGVAAQDQPGPYRPPYGPTLSPYLDYFRRDVGLLDRHNALVVPGIRGQQAIQQLHSRISEQRSQLSNLAGEIQQIRDPHARRTGTASAFMNYSHYYRFNPQAPAPGR